MPLDCHWLRLRQELEYQLPYLVGARDHEEVSVVDELKPRVPDKKGQDPAVDDRADRIVGTHQHECRLPQLVQPGQAGPASSREQLVDVTETARGRDMTPVLAHKVGISAECAAV